MWGGKELFWEFLYLFACFRKEKKRPGWWWDRNHDYLFWYYFWYKENITLFGSPVLRLMYLVHKSATEHIVHVENLGTFEAYNVSVLSQAWNSWVNKFVIKLLKSLWPLHWQASATALNKENLDSHYTSNIHVSNTRKKFCVSVCGSIL